MGSIHDEQLSVKNAFVTAARRAYLACTQKNCNESSLSKYVVLFIENKWLSVVILKEYFLNKFGLCVGGGQVVSILAFLSDNQSLNPTKVYIFV